MARTRRANLARKKDSQKLDDLRCTENKHVCPTTNPCCHKAEEELPLYMYTLENNVVGRSEYCLLCRAREQLRSKVQSDHRFSQTTRTKTITALEGRACLESFWERMRQWKAALLFQEVQVSEELWQKLYECLCTAIWEFIRSTDRTIFETGCREQLRSIAKSGKRKRPSTSSDPDSEPQESISEIKRDDQRESDLNISPHAGDARKTSLDDGLKDGHSATEPPSMTCRMQTSPHEDEDEQLPGTSQVLQDNPNLSTAAVVANNAMAFLHKWIETGSNMEAIVSRIQAEPSSQGQLSIVTTLYEQLKKYVHIDLKRMDLIIEGCQRDWEALQLVEQQQQEALQLKEEQQREALQLMEQQQQHALQLEEEQQRKALQSKEQRQRELESSLKSI